VWEEGGSEHCVMSGDTICDRATFAGTIRLRAGEGGEREKAVGV
jgi:hypothetical protein